MPSIFDFFPDAAVLWAPRTANGFPNGGSTADAIQITTRWSDGRKGRIDEDESVILVDRDIAIGSFLLKGTLADISDVSDDPNDYPAAQEVLKIYSADGISEGCRVRKVWLADANR